MRKKILSLLLLGILVLSLAGCGDTTDVENEDAKTKNPDNPRGSAYTGISYDTTDMDGNPINTADIFAGNKITMVNIWATWCPPCVGELPELEKLNNELKAKNCAIVGIIYDGYEDGALDNAKAILEQTGVAYTMLMPTDELRGVFPLGAFPTSYFVDSKGNIAGDPIVGAYVKGYEAAIDALLTEQKGVVYGK